MRSNATRASRACVRLQTPGQLGTLLYPLIHALLCGHPLIYTLLYPLMPSYTYLLIHPLTHTLLCMCIFSIGLQNHWAPFYTVLCMCRFCLLANPWAAYYFIYPSLAWGSSYYCRGAYMCINVNIVININQFLTLHLDFLRLPLLFHISNILQFNHERRKCAPKKKIFDFKQVCI